jgi:hypothetical protein
MPRRSSALQPWRRIALHRGHAGLSSVAGKQQAWDVREGELNFD